MTARKQKHGARGIGRRIQQSETFLDLAGRVAAGHIRAVYATSKIIRDPVEMDRYLEALNPMIVAMWHGQFLLLPLIKPKTVPVRNMVARHADGEMIGRALLHFDMGLIRGAGAGGSGKDRGGASAFRAALKTLKSDITVAMTADIPPGPARVAGLGIVTLAKASGCPIVPLAMATDRFLTLPTWSRFTLNLPFSNLAMVAGEPIHVPRDADEREMEAYRLKVEAAMNAATERAYALAGSDASRTAPRKAEVENSGFMLTVYRGLTAVARPAAGAILRSRLKRGKEVPERTRERLGFATVQRPDGPLFWFHAASIGEANSIFPLIDALKRRHPTLQVLLTTVTVTAAAIAAQRLPRGAVHQFAPLDNPLFCRRFLDHWRPDLGLFTESEIWPNLIVEARRRDVPLVLVNGRMSQRSYKRWKRLPSLSRPVFSRFDLALTQNWRVAKRLTSLGARTTSITGNLKYDAPPPPVDRPNLEELLRVTEGRPIFLAASTHPGEEDVVARAHEMLRGAMPSLLTIIAPRHPERGAAISQLLGARGLSSSRRSARDMVSHTTDVYIADTVGELGLFYALSPFSFVGGSIVAHGGQNPVEAIKLGSAVLSGPHTFNFAETYTVLERYRGFRLVSEAEDLAATLKALFHDQAEAAEMKRRAAAAIATLSGALDKTLEALEPYIARVGLTETSGALVHTDYAA